jgi:hypothetical protein
MQRVWLRERVRYVMDEDETGQRPHEEKRGGAGIIDGDDAGIFGPGEIVGDDAKSAAGRSVVPDRIEGDHQRGMTGAVIHLQRQVLGQSALDERDPFRGHTPQHDTRVGRCVGRGQVEDALRQRDCVPAHGRVEEILLRLKVPKEGGRGDTELAGDVGECGPLKAFQREDTPGGLQNPLAAENRGTAHL